MHMTIKDRSGVEVDYPNKCVPPISKMITPNDGSMAMQFYRTFVHILTSSDIDSGYLVVSWFGFCEDALSTNVIQLSIIDQQGYIWQCDMVFIMADNTIF